MSPEFVQTDLEYEVPILRPPMIKDQVYKKIGNLDALNLEEAFEPGGKKQLKRNSSFNK